MSGIETLEGVVDTVTVVPFVGEIHLRDTITASAKTANERYLLLALGSGQLLLCHRLDADSQWHEQCRIVTRYTGPTFAAVSYCGGYILIADDRAEFHTFARYGPHPDEWKEECIVEQCSSRFFFSTLKSFSAEFSDAQLGRQWCLSNVSGQRFLFTRQMQWWQWNYWWKFTKG